VKVTIEATEFPVYAIDAAGRSIYIPQGSIGSFYAEAHVSVKRVEPIENAKVTQPMPPEPPAIDYMRIVGAPLNLGVNIVADGRKRRAVLTVIRDFEQKGCMGMAFEPKGKWPRLKTADIVKATMTFMGLEDGYKCFSFDLWGQGQPKGLRAFQLNDLEN